MEPHTAACSFLLPHLKEVRLNIVLRHCQGSVFGRVAVSPVTTKVPNHVTQQGAAHTRSRTGRYTHIHSRHYCRQAPHLSWMRAQNRQRQRLAVSTSPSMCVSMHAFREGAPRFIECRSWLDTDRGPKER